MAGKLFICIIIALALIQPFHTLPAADSQKGEYYTSDGIIVSQDPIYWRPKNVKSPSEHVVIVEPTITYTRHAEYQPATTSSFRSSTNERDSDFKPYDGSARGDGAVAYYPYYIRAASSDIEERKKVDERVRVIDVSDPAYQRFVPRGQSEGGYYYESRNNPKETATVSSRSSVRFYYPNGTAVRTYYNEDNQQVMDIHPNQYVIQVADTKTTTPKPTSTDSPVYWRNDVDCPPFTPCNTVVYQPASTQCCRCYLIQNRCCPCTYGTTSRKN